MRGWDYYGTACPSVLFPGMMQKHANSQPKQLRLNSSRLQKKITMAFRMANYVYRIQEKKKATFNFIITVCLESLTMFGYIPKQIMINSKRLQDRNCNLLIIRLLLI